MEFALSGSDTPVSAQRLFLLKDVYDTGMLDLVFRRLFEDQSIGFIYNQMEKILQVNDVELVNAPALQNIADIQQVDKAEIFSSEINFKINKNFKQENGYILFQMFDPRNMNNTSLRNFCRCFINTPREWICYMLHLGLKFPFCMIDTQNNNCYIMNMAQILRFCFMNDYNNIPYPEAQLQNQLLIYARPPGFNHDDNEALHVLFNAMASSVFANFGNIMQFMYKNAYSKYMTDNEKLLSEVIVFNLDGNQISLISLPDNSIRNIQWNNFLQNNMGIVGANFQIINMINYNDQADFLREGVYGNPFLPFVDLEESLLDTTFLTFGLFDLYYFYLFSSNRGRAAMDTLGPNTYMYELLTFIFTSSSQVNMVTISFKTDVKQMFFKLINEKVFYSAIYQNKTVKSTRQTSLLFCVPLALSQVTITQNLTLDYYRFYLFFSRFKDKNFILNSLTGEGRKLYIYFANAGLIDYKSTLKNQFALVSQ